MPQPASKQKSSAAPLPNSPQSIWQQLLRKLRPALRATLDALADELLTRADKASNAEQNRLLEARAKLIAQRDGLLDRYCRLLRELPPCDAAMLAPTSAELRLVSHEDQEEDVQLRILSSRAANRSGQPLVELLARLQHLSRHPLAIGPAELLRGLRDTLKASVDDLDVRVLAYGLFEERFLRLLPDHYRDWNQQLANQGVAPSTPKASSSCATAKTPSSAATPHRQRNPATDQADGTPPAPGLFDELQHTLARQFREKGQPPENPQQILHSQLRASTTCDAETRQVAGWVDMIMEYIRQDQQLPESTRHALSCLQPTMVRIALRDRKMFTHSQHPARQLLERLTRASLMYRGGNQESLVQSKIQQTMLHLLEQFDGDLSLLTQLNADLDAFLNDLQQQAERVEKRQIEQLCGQERLLSARQFAQQAIARRLSEREVAPILREFLEHNWVNVLLLLELQHGRESQAWRDGLALADTLLDQAYGPGSKQDPARALRVRFDLFQAIRARLVALVELSQRQIDQCVHILSQAIQAIQQQNTDLLDSLEFSERPQAIGLLSEAEQWHAEQPPMALDAELQQYLKKIESLAFGTWFYFHDQPPPQQKLAWYSPVSNHCLFVDRRGHRTRLLSTHDFARLMRDAKVRLLEDSDLGSTWLSKMMSFLKEKMGQLGQSLPATD